MSVGRLWSVDRLHEQPLASLQLHRREDLAGEGRAYETTSSTCKATLVHSSRCYTHFINVCWQPAVDHARILRVILTTRGGKCRHGNEAPSASRSVEQDWETHPGMREAPGTQCPDHEHSQCGEVETSSEVVHYCDKHVLMRQPGRLVGALCRQPLPARTSQAYNRMTLTECGSGSGM